jgi:uracil permease
MILAAVILVTGIGGYKLDLTEITFSAFLSNLTIDNIAMATFLGIFLHAILPDKQSAHGTNNSLETAQKTI